MYASQVIYHEVIEMSNGVNCAIKVVNLVEWMLGGYFIFSGMLMIFLWYVDKFNFYFCDCRFIETYFCLSCGSGYCVSTHNCWNYIRQIVKWQYS